MYEQAQALFYHLRWHLTYLSVEVYDGDWGRDSLNHVYLKVTCEFILHQSLTGRLRGQVVQETKGTSALS